MEEREVSEGKPVKRKPRRRRQIGRRDRRLWCDLIRKHERRMPSVSELVQCGLEI